MRKIAIIASLLISTLAFSQDLKVPNSVMTTFDKMFSDVENVKWKQIKNNYQATFKDGKTTVAVFTPEGKWLKTSITISKSALPAKAAKYISDNFENAEIKKVQRVENNKNVSIYLVSLVVGDDKVKVKFNKEGAVIDK